MSNSSNVLDVIVDLTLLVAGSPTTRLTGIDPLENAQTPEILQANLQFAQTGRSTNEGGINTGMVLLLLLAHAGQFALRPHPTVGCGLDALLLHAALDAIAHGCVLFSVCILRSSEGTMQLTATCTSP